MELDFLRILSSLVRIVVILYCIAKENGAMNMWIANKPYRLQGAHFVLLDVFGPSCYMDSSKMTCSWIDVLIDFHWLNGELVWSDWYSNLNLCEGTHSDLDLIQPWRISLRFDGEHANAVRSNSGKTWDKGNKSFFVCVVVDDRRRRLNESLPRLAFPFTIFFFNFKPLSFFSVLTSIYKRFTSILDSSYFLAHLATIFDEEGRWITDGEASDRQLRGRCSDVRLLAHRKHLGLWW